MEDSLEFILVLGVAGLIALFVLWFLFVAFVEPHSRLDIEKDKIPLYTSTSGGRIGFPEYKGPFISLRIYEEFVIIGYFNKKIKFKFEDIDRIEIKKRSTLSPKGIQIIHQKTTIPNRIIIWITKPAQVKEIIDTELQKRM